MDKQFKKPLLILLWAVVVVMIAFAVLFVYGMWLGLTDPLLYIE